MSKYAVLLTYNVSKFHGKVKTRQRKMNLWKKNVGRIIENRLFLVAEYIFLHTQCNHRHIIKFVLWF